MEKGFTVSVIVDVELSFSVTMTKSVFVEKNLELGQKVWLSSQSDLVKVIN